MAEAGPEHLAEEIKNVIAGFVEKSPRNYCRQMGERYFDPPLVGFARGDDPVFGIVKEQVGLLSMAPSDAVHIPAESGHPFRFKPDTHFNLIRTPIPK